MPFIGEQPAAEEAAKVTVTPNNSANETVYPVFVDTASGAQGAETDLGLTYNPSTGLLTAVKVAVTTLGIGGTDIAASAAELNLLAGKAFLDDDTFSADSPTGIASQQSIKAYVAANGGAYNDWRIEATAYTAVSKDQIICDAPSTPFVITLPTASVAGENKGDTVTICNAGAALVTIGRNGSNINSAGADGTLPNGNSVQLVYVSDAIGWFEV